MNIKQSIATIVFVILVIILIPLPINEKQSYYEFVSDWKLVVVQEGQGKYSVYPKYSIDSDSGYISVSNGPGTSSYIESTFVVPKRGNVFAYNHVGHGSYDRGGYIELYDSNGVCNYIKPLPYDSIYDRSAEYDISPYGGQEVTLRIPQSYIPGHNPTQKYGNMRIINKPYTLWDNLNIFKNMLISVLLVSILIGFIIGVSGLEFFNRYVNKIEMHIHENKTSGMGFENKYINRFLKLSFCVLDAPFFVAEKIGNIRLRNWIKITSVLFLSVTIIYITYILAYITIMVVLALVTLAIILWIIFSLLGGSPSGGSVGGGGGSYGSGGGSSSSSSGTIFGSSYEGTAKEESRPFKIDKETRSSEGALPFGLGGDTIYKTEYEDTSTDDTVKGYGWNRSEADFNARKNLKKK